MGTNLRASVVELVRVLVQNAVRLTAMEHTRHDDLEGQRAVWTLVRDLVWRYDTDSARRELEHSHKGIDGRDDLIPDRTIDDINARALEGIPLLYAIRASSCAPLEPL